MMNNTKEEKKSDVWGGGGAAVGGGVQGVRWDVGVGVACSLRNFYGTQELKFH